MADRADSTRADARRFIPETSTTRRSILAGIVAAPVVALPAYAAVRRDVGPDPIFPALDAFQKAEERHSAAMDVHDALRAEWQRDEAAFPDYVEIPITLRAASLRGSSGWPPRFIGSTTDGG